MKQKTIIAVWNIANKGKTETLRYFSQDFLLSFIKSHQKSSYRIYLADDTQVEDIPSSGDFKLLVTIENIKIAVVSKGDPKTLLDKRLMDLAKEGYDLIICTCRTRGETVKAIQSVEKSYKYNTIWTGTYQSTTKFDRSKLNKLKAKHIFELVSEFIFNESNLLEI